MLCCECLGDSALLVELLDLLINVRFERLFHEAVVEILGERFLFVPFLVVLDEGERTAHLTLLILHVLAV